MNKLSVILRKQGDHDVCVSAKKYGFPDLVLIPVLMDDKTPVTKENLEQWNMTAEEAVNQGLESIGSYIYKMGDMYIVTCQYGAVGIIKAKEKLKEIFPQGYVVCPSSIHEMIVVDGIVNDEFLMDLVSSVNKMPNCVKPEDVLSDSVYRFN